MVKVPVAGRVKTRLARSVGFAEATRFYRHTLASVVGRLARDSRWTTILAVSPDTGLASRALPARVARVRQGGGDLGQRMDRLMRLTGPGPTIIVGTDIPAITPALISAAFRLLARADAVLGPAPDGGYWLVGLRRSPRIPRAFDHVRWSSEHTLADTRASLGAAEVATAAILGDVDGSIDLEHVAGWFGRRTLPSEIRHNWQASG
jgi:rSAM/selenodomain-associated transferase 1